MNHCEFLFRVPLMSKARPRTPRSGGRPYMPKAYMSWKEALRSLMAEWWTIPPLEKVSCLVLTFSGPARGDLDNMAGAVLDSGNGLIWVDDRVSVIPCIASRWNKCKQADSSIYMKVVWE